MKKVWKLVSAVCLLRTTLLAKAGNLKSVVIQMAEILGLESTDFLKLKHDSEDIIFSFLIYFSFML